jgi:predicted nucleic acid-binding protein
VHTWRPSIDELAQPDLWESDEEYEAFLAGDLAHRLADQQVAVPCSLQAATVWGEIQAHARLRGRPRRINDSWIAASCARVCHRPGVSRGRAG